MGKSKAETIQTSYEGINIAWIFQPGGKNLQGRQATKKDRRRIRRGTHLFDPSEGDSAF